jgi:hypothetical protein
MEALTNPQRLLARSEVIQRPCPIPLLPGVYAWYFKQIPPGVPTEGCLTKDGHTLLYVGISPKNDSSGGNLRKRVAHHFRGNAEGSTLRLTLGVLLEPLSDFPLRRVGSGNRMTLTHVGERWLDDWMSENARVCWIEHASPWEPEAEMLRSVSLPLNLQGNAHHPFSQRLGEIRKAAKLAAREMPIANEGNQQRS